VFDELETLTDVCARIRQQQVSPVELVEACLERIQRLQPRLNAFITVAAESARETARAAEGEIRDGRWRGPLHGIPVGIKDFYDTAGVATTAAFEPFRKRVPVQDAVSVAKLKQAGAIVIGKTNMHTLGGGTTGLESAFGPVRNPWNADYIPGGSSSGSAAAVASGLCYATLDTDAIGSCRLPAACCGVVGFKGSYGLIDMAGILAGEQPPDDTIRWLSHAGITTRGASDTRLMLDVLAETAGHRDGTRWRTAVAGHRKRRIGVADNIKVDKEVSEAFDKAVATIRSLGHDLGSARAPLTDFRKGIASIERDREEIGRLAFANIDALMLPTIPTRTPTIQEAAKNPLALSADLTMFANYYGLPAVSVRCGVDSRGLPAGVQFVAKRGDDATILDLAADYETVSQPVTYRRE